MTNDQQYRQLICDFGRRIHSAGYVAANDGNISVRLNDNTILITPTGVSKGALQPGGIALIDGSGNRLDENVPSSEFRMHLAIYQRCPEVNAIIHTHPPYATAWAVTGKGLTEPTLPEVIISIGKIPLVEYRPPSTQALAELVGRTACNYDVMLLQNHGLVTIGSDLETAFFNTERAEHAFKVSTIANSIGTAKPLSKIEIKALFGLYPVPERVRKMFEQQ